MNRFSKILIAATLIAAFFPPAFAGELALYEGADRDARLLEAAKKEGEVSIYYNYPNLNILAAAFTKKYGIKVKSWRSSSEGILQRVVSEARGGRFEVDIVQDSAQENEALHREKLLQAVKSPHLKDLMPQAIPSHQEWVGTKLNVFIMAYNTDNVKKEELPKSYQDLLDPKWKGRLGIEANNHHWFATLTHAMGEQQAQKLFENIISTNGVSIRKGHSLLTQLVASGEVPLSLTVYDWNIGPLKQNGAPIDGFALQPTVAQFDSMAVHKRAPHPNAALLFYDFVLSDEGQQLIADTSAIPASKKFDSPYTKLRLQFVDPGKVLDMNDAWKKTWDEVIVKKAMQ